MKNRSEKPIVNVWDGCYPSQWNGKIVKDAMSHPAKFSSRLIAKIYDHILKEGWAKAGDSILDPFGGVALGALDAMRLGLNWQGIELEPKFHGIGNQNIEMWMKKMGHLPRWGSAKLHLGDSRHLLDVLNGEISVAVSSPPFAEAVSGGGIAKKGYQNEATRKGSQDKPFDLVGKRAYMPENQGVTNGQLSSMKSDGFEIAISSPPFLQSEGGSPEPKAGGTIDKAMYKRHAAGNKSTDAYGKSKGQLSSMREGGFEAAVSSPPFEGSNPDGGYQLLGKYAAEGKLTVKQVKGNKNKSFKSWDADRNTDYAPSETNLGNSEGDDFWLASRAIVEQVYLSLVPGGHAVWVVKDYVKNKAIVPFSDQWRQLCEAVGFITLHEHHATLIRNVKKQYNLENELITTQNESKSFFRRIYEKKGGHRIDYECVLCMMKEKR